MIGRIFFVFHDFKCSEVHFSVSRDFKEVGRRGSILIMGGVLFHKKGTLIGVGKKVIVTK